MCPVTLVSEIQVESEIVDYLKSLLYRHAFDDLNHNVTRGFSYFIVSSATEENDYRNLKRKKMQTLRKREKIILEIRYETCSDKTKVGSELIDCFIKERQRF